MTLASDLIMGEIRQLSSCLTEPIQYSLPIGDTLLAVNQFLGKTLTLSAMAKIHCVYCNRLIKKSYSQGYCFPCSQTLARCDLCIVKPEKCHYRFGTCREPEWGEKHCFILHIIYIANTSGIKVGITRETQIPTRWINQGAVQALPIFRVQNRYHSGLVEVACKEWLADKTDWRKMLMGVGDVLDLEQKRDQILNYMSNHAKGFDISIIEVIGNQKPISIQYPVLEYPKKVKSINLERTPQMTGQLLGIKGQYFIFDVGVINIRNISGHVLSIKIH